jgi:hypothetical protein
MTGIKEQRHISALGLVTELKQPLGHFLACEIGSFNHVEADVPEHGRHGLRINRWVGKCCNVLVRAIANDKGDAPVALAEFALARIPMTDNAMIKERMATLPFSVPLNLARAASAGSNTVAARELDHFSSDFTLWTVIQIT